MSTVKDNLILGDWNAICDRCGFKYKASALKEEWTGWMVCDKCWEPRHPQDLIRGIPDDPSVPWSRPDTTGAESTSTDVQGTSVFASLAVETHGDVNYTVISTDDSIHVFNTEFTADRTITVPVTGYNEGDTITIYVTEDSAYTLSILVPVVIIDSVTALGGVNPFLLGLGGADSFITNGVQTGDLVTNTTASTTALVVTVPSATSILLDTHIFVNMASESYTIAQNQAFNTITVPSVTTIKFNGTTWVVSDYYTLGL